MIIPTSTVGKCYRCSRPLTAETSLRFGIGPICRAKAREKLAAEDQRSRENKRCHHGFVCSHPDHIKTVLGRFLGRFQAMSRTEVAAYNQSGRVQILVSQIASCLGLDRPRVAIPEIDVPDSSFETLVMDLKLPPVESKSGGLSVAIPSDYEEQMTRRSLRDHQICPFGLDCQQPGKAFSLVWELISLLRFDVEPHLTRHSGWRWDHLVYQGLADIFTLMGELSDSYVVMEVVDKRGEI